MTFSSSQRIEETNSFYGNKKSKGESHAIVAAAASTRIGYNYNPYNTLTLFIQMEYCDGGSLRDILNEGKATFELRMDYFVQVCFIELY
jgi:serine/threonine protein kinase